MIALLLAAAAAVEPPLADAPPRPAAHPFALSARPDREVVTLGEPFSVTIRVEHPALYELLAGYYRQDPGTQ